MADPITTDDLVNPLTFPEVTAAEVDTRFVVLSDGTRIAASALLGLIGSAKMYQKGKISGSSFVVADELDPTRPILAIINGVFKDVGGPDPQLTYNPGTKTFTVVGRSISNSRVTIIATPKP